MADYTVTRQQQLDPNFKLTVKTGEVHRVILETSWYEVQIVDARGEPVPNIHLQFSSGASSARESPEPVATDNDGVARFQGGTAFKLHSALADGEAARTVLDERWASGRDESLSDRGYLLQSLQEAVKGFSVIAQQRLVVALVPLVVRVRLIGMHFDTSKCLLLPSAMVGVRRLCSIYEEHPNTRVLVVGHADTAGEEYYNSRLSLERADSIGAFLTEQVESWLAWYEPSKPSERRWDTREDQHMLSALPDEKNPYYAGQVSGINNAATVAAVKRLQCDAGLEIDGVAGPITRRALIQRYMALDGTTLPAGCELVTHGCGEYFTEEKTEENQDSLENRRAEIFFFEGPIVPPPPGKISARGSTEYPAWRAQVTWTLDLSQEDPPPIDIGPRVLRLRLHGISLMPLPAAPFRACLNERLLADGFADATGWAVVPLPADTCFELVVVDWEDPGPSREKHTKTILIDCSKGNDRDQAVAKLHNLGYCREVFHFEAAVLAFQSDYGIEDETGLADDGTLPPRTRDRLWQIYDNRDCVATTKTGQSAVT